MRLVQQRNAVTNRVHKVLEDANIKLGAVASDVLGVSGRAMLEAMIAGQEDAVALAALAQRQLRGKIPELQRALPGRVTAHHRFLLRELLEQDDSLERAIARVSARIAEVAPRPFQEAARQLDTIVGWLSAGPKRSWPRSAPP